MNCTKHLWTGTAAFVVSALLIAMSSSAAQAKSLKWAQMFGLVESGNTVGVGTGTVAGAAPWVVTSGRAHVDLATGKVDFRVHGLVLAVGSAQAGSSLLSGLGIGTNAGVTEVKGTLVCNVSGASGDSTLTDTAAVPLSFQGNAKFSGRFTSIPAICTTAPSDTAFLIRIVSPAGFADLWIAAGGVLSVVGM